MCKFSKSFYSYRCEKFIYGGCEGNANRFDDRESCMDMCQNEMPDICLLDYDMGPCEAADHQFYYNAER